jgi:hypothetical protein
MKRANVRFLLTRTVLEAPYKTNWRNYDLGNVNVNQSQQECYQSCVLNWYREKCSCIPKVQFPLSFQNLKKEDRLCLDGSKCYDPAMEDQEIIMMSSTNNKYIHLML